VVLYIEFTSDVGSYPEAAAAGPLIATVAVSAIATAAVKAITAVQMFDTI
jgi:hydroxyacyl-ACP dehydratase HTD2-like protein with hotdog domain